MRIEACYDSHLHWPALGEFAQRLSLRELKSPSEVCELKPEPHHFRGEWLIGFGYDDNRWSEKPHRRILDQWIPEKPVALTRCDGHALWLNTEALRRAEQAGLKNLRGGEIQRDAQGEATGIVVDKACEAVEALIPAVTGFEMRRHLLKAVQMLNEAGFTHVRDMTCDQVQWNEAVRLDQSGLLTLAVEEYFWLKDIADLDPVLDLAKRARAQKCSRLRVRGLKLFLDGALGSQGAWLSHPYHGTHESGLVLWEDAAMREAIQKTWENGFEVAVHVIGDAAADHLTDLALELKARGVVGPLHFEHAELVRESTIEKMRGLNVTCHLQPSHWLSDHHWLSQKVGDLSACAFPWRKLQEAEIPFHFGSDAPIEPARVALTLQALEQSAEKGIPRLLGDPTTYMRHPDLSWVPNCYTLFENNIPKQVVFAGEHLL